MLELHFAIIKFTGLFCPINWSRRRKFMYNIYSIIIIGTIYSIVLTQLARLMTARSFDDFNDTFFISLSSTTVAINATYDIIFNGKIRKLVGMFEDNYFCIARDDFEKAIQQKYDDMCRKIEIRLLMMVYSTTVSFLIAPLYYGLANRELPYKVLLPYDLQNIKVYWLTYTYHAISAFLMITVKMTNIAMIAGFKLQICAQLDFLKNRLGELARIVEENSKSDDTIIDIRVFQREQFNENVRHHIHIYKIADTVSKTFKYIIISLYYANAAGICVSIYQVSAKTVNIAETFWFMLLLLCLMGELFVYCYFGNEVTIRSKEMIDDVYNTNWISLSLELRKDLTFVILRLSKPIEISCGPFVHLTLESFVKVVKTSYSVFSVLKSST